MYAKILSSLVICKGGLTMGDITYEFFKRHLREYCQHINMLDENIVISEADSKKFSDIKTNNIDIHELEHLLDNVNDSANFIMYKSAIIFFESIGLLLWDNRINRYVLEPSKLAIKNIEYNRYMDTKEEYAAKVKKLG